MQEKKIVKYLKIKTPPPLPAKRLFGIKEITTFPTSYYMFKVIKAIFLCMCEEIHCT